VKESGGQTAPAFSPEEPYELLLAVEQQAPMNLDGLPFNAVDLANSPALCHRNATGGRAIRRLCMLLGASSYCIGGCFWM